VAQSFGWASMVAGRSGVDLARKELGRGFRKVEEVEGGGGAAARGGSRGQSGVDLARKKLSRGLRKVEEVEGGAMQLLIDGVEAQQPEMAGACGGSGSAWLGWSWRRKIGTKTGALQDKVMVELNAVQCARTGASEGVQGF